MGEGLTVFWQSGRLWQTDRRTEEWKAEAREERSW